MSRYMAPQHNTVTVDSTAAFVDDRAAEFHSTALKDMEVLREIIDGREATPADIQLMAGVINRLSMMIVGLEMRVTENPELADLFNEMDNPSNSEDGKV